MSPTVSTERSVMLSTPGGPGDSFQMFRFRAGQAAASLYLWCSLGALCGRLRRAESGNFEPVGEPSGWLALADVAPDAVVVKVERAEARYPGFALDAAHGEPVHDRVACHFERAAERLRREG